MKRLIIFILLATPCLCWAADLLPFPSDCDTSGEKVCYSYRAQELLRYEHNVMSYWLFCGLTQDEYDNGLLADCKNDLCCGVNELTILGPKLKAAFSYSEYINEAQMLNYIENWWRPRQKRVGSEAVKSRDACLKDPFCQSELFKVVDGPDGQELRLDKDLASVSSIYPIVVDDISKVEAVSISK